MAKQSQMYMNGDRCIGLREYLQRGERRAKKVRALIRQGKTDAQIAREIGISSERVRQIRNERGKANGNDRSSSQGA